MLGLVMRFLSPDTRALVQLAMRMVSSLDTPEERKAVAQFGMKMLESDQISITDWAAFGKLCGVFRLGGKNGK